MTLRAVEPVRLTIPKQEGWLEYDLPPLCQVPECSRTWDHRHHILRRSQTSGPKRWVTIDGLVVPNVMAICERHHDQVTGMVGGHQAKIRFPSVEALRAGLYSAWWLWYARLPQRASQPHEWQLLGPIDRPVYL